MRKSLMKMLVYRRSVGPNYVSNDFQSWLTETVSDESRPNLSIPEILIPFQTVSV